MDAQVIEKIEDYLDGKISRQELEEQLRNAPVEDIDEEINWLKNTRLAIEAEGLQDRLADLFKEQTDNKEASIRKINWRRSSWLVAASIALLIAGYFVFNQVQQPLYEEYRYVDPGIPSLMSGASNYELADAMTYYSEGNYQTAYAKLQNLYDPGDPNDTVSYYLGASLLYQGNPEDSREYLIEVMKSGDSPFRERAEWLLALSYIKEGKPSEAMNILEQILADEDHLFYSKAEALREEIQ